MEDMRRMLNEAYLPLHTQARALVDALTGWHGHRITHGFFNGHYHKAADGQFQMDVYPIPVISVMGLCDIEIDFDGITVTAKLSKAQVEAMDWARFEGAHFEVYGVEDYLLDMGTEQDMEALVRQARDCSEKEVFVSFSFPLTAAINDMIHFLEFIYSNRFYY